MSLVLLVTRDAEDAPATAARLRGAGFTPRVASLIVRQADDAVVHDALAAHPTPDVLLLTSAFAARQVGRVRTDTFRPRRVAAVGPATAAAAAVAGLRVDLTPVEATGADLVGALGDLDQQEVLYPSAAEAQRGTREALERAGAQVFQVMAYRTLPSPGGPEALRAAGKVDAVLLASPSTARAYVAACARTGLSHVPPVVPIGPTTAEACRTLGLPMAEASLVAAVRTALRGL